MTVYRNILLALDVADPLNADRAIDSAKLIAEASGAKVHLLHVRLTLPMTWFDAQLQGGFDHVLIGSSLPFLLAPGLHYVEAFSEALADGGWGKRWRKPGELLRQGVDLEHWAAFQKSFQRVCAMVLDAKVM